VQRGLPWQTLLFNPKPEDPNHPGKASPKDHLIADLFWMPVVEPYAISTPMATAGKINLNYQLMPFGAYNQPYIQRATGLYAVMKSTRFLALPVGDSTTYKPLDYGGPNFINTNRRRAINIAETLKAFEVRFQSGGFFRSASEICDMNLVPLESGVTYTDSSMKTFWNNNKLTGDNLREKPYADLYSRLTTKSNAFTVHVKAQALKQTIAPNAAADAWATWDESRDMVLGEYRGSSIIERYIDPTLPIADFATDASANLNDYYRFRTVATKQLGQ
jgi:uncharacterized protein (TIGR02600 family)